MPLTDAEKKRAQRKRDKDRGLVRVEVKVKQSHVERVKRFARSLAD